MSSTYATANNSGNIPIGFETRRKCMQFFGRWNVFVETLDKCFENVCELDLIFHVDKVHYILNELVMGGMVLETNMSEIIARIEEQNLIEKQEMGISAAPARAVSAVKNMNLSQQLRDMKLPDLSNIGSLKF
ncbi:hypothetical protein RDWZM_002516 [Blomia tropicalis]|uniref:AP complex mu/sigma subunit domain-containing protein n=1 Tax=Blomia tropicalis TaxID=40697 RepID=A0A9Q0RRP3_BLOTA|nr:hypothetical protein RDWZM_002516 [Blomia tropicalis]